MCVHAHAYVMIRDHSRWHNTEDTPSLMATHRIGIPINQTPFVLRAPHCSFCTRARTNAHTLSLSHTHFYRYFTSRQTVTRDGVAFHSATHLLSLCAPQRVMNAAPVDGAHSLSLSLSRTLLWILYKPATDHYVPIIAVCSSTRLP